MAPRSKIRVLDPLSDTETEPEEEEACQAGLVGWRTTQTRTQTLCPGYCTGIPSTPVHLPKDDAATSDLSKDANGKVWLC